MKLVIQVIAMAALMLAPAAVEAAMWGHGQVSCLANKTSYDYKDICVGWTIQSTPPLPDYVCNDPDNPNNCKEVPVTTGSVATIYTFVDGVEQGSELLQSEVETLATGLEVKVLMALKDGACSLFVGDQQCNSCASCTCTSSSCTSNVGRVADCTNAPNGRQIDECEALFPVFYPLHFSTKTIQVESKLKLRFYAGHGKEPSEADINSLILEIVAFFAAQMNHDPYFAGDSAKFDVSDFSYFEDNGSLTFELDFTSHIQFDSYLEGGKKEICEALAEYDLKTFIEEYAQMSHPFKVQLVVNKLCGQYE